MTPNSTCALHFDMDNDFDCEKIALFCDLLRKYIMESLNIKFPPSYIIILDSSGFDKEIKWKNSLHVVCRMLSTQGEHRFQNNIACGFFVKEFLKSLVGDFPNLISGIDDIYTPKRSLRIYLSTKLGERRYFRLHQLSRNHQFFFNSDLLRITLVSMSVKIPEIQIKYPVVNFSHHNNNIALNIDLDFFESCAKFLDQYVVDGNVTKIIRARYPWYIARTTSNYCQYIKKNHKRNHSYLMINVRENIIIHRCYDPCCIQKTFAKIIIPDYLSKSIENSDVEEQMMKINFDDFSV